MSKISRASKDLETILGANLFKSLINNDVLKLAQLQAIISILIKACVDFDLTFTCGTRRTATGLELTVYINPSTTISFIISLEAGSTAFGGLPPAPPA